MTNKPVHAVGMGGEARGESSGRSNAKGKAHGNPFEWAAENEASGTRPVCYNLRVRNRRAEWLFSTASLPALPLWETE